MSGDGQPKKRRDKRRRKEEEELYPNLKDTDEVIHVHKDAHTGGNLITKIIFFFLMGGLAIMIGLILLELRGTTDDNRVDRETPWSLQFDDWSKILAVPDLVPEFFKGEQEDHSHHDGHAGEEVDDHGGHDDHEEHGHEDDHHEEPAQDGGWFSFSLGGFGGSEGQEHEEGKEEVAEPVASSSWFSLDYFGGEEKTEEPTDELEDAPASEEVEGAELSGEHEAEEEEEEEENASPEELDGGEEDEEDEENSAKEEFDEEENVSGPLDEDEPLSAEKSEEDEEPDLSLLDDGPLSRELDENEAISEENEEDDPRGSVFPRRSSIIEEDEAESAEQEQEEEEVEEETEEKTLPEGSEEELFPEAIEALQREASELLRQQKEAEEAAETTEEPAEEEEEESPTESNDDEETEGMALKFGVGVALVVVAHVVLVKKWNSWAGDGNEGKVERRTSSPVREAPPTSVPSRTPPPTPEPLKSESPEPAWAEETVRTAESVVSSIPPRTPTPDDEYEEESEPEEEEEDLSEDVPPINPKIYEELIAKYGQPTPESSDAEASDGNREYSDGGEVESVGEEESGGELEESEPEEEGQRWTTVKKPIEIETESEDEEEEEEESEDEPPPLRPSQGGAKSAQLSAADHEEALIRRQLELADEEFNVDRHESALAMYRKVLSSQPKNARALYGVARVLDRQAETKRSNALLQEAIDQYVLLLSVENVPDVIFLPAAQRAINRLRFRGLYMQAVGVNKMLIERFNDTVEYHNDLAILYLMVNRLEDAGRVFLNTLAKWPDDPVARSHYGLVLKLGGKMEESIPHLLQGLQQDHPSTRDARLYFHLGDALARSSRPEEAKKVYKSGVEKGLFRSEYQRSLYNVDHLTGRPWWKLKETTYEEFFKMLESNWKVIRDEGLAAMKLKGLYQDEAENLRDVGDWKQFQLFARGNRYAENCKKTPVTCKIIGDFAPARGCKRGQSKFSVMEGGTHVWPHCGPTNCRLRAHLGLVVPPGPAIRVGGDTRKWKEGKVMVFDDSFEHEVWHNGTKLRLVLIVDVWHPELTSAEKATLTPI